MARRAFDPLALVPPAGVIRDKLRETEHLAARLRIMLDLAERLEQSARAATPAADRGAIHDAGDHGQS